jgi:hypothetical protein
MSFSLHQLDREVQYRDPLLEGTQAIGLPEFSAALCSLDR